MITIQKPIFKDETVQRATGIAFGVAALGSIAYLGYNWSQVIVPLTINGYNCSLTGGGTLFTVTATALTILMREVSNFRINF